jgi:hypothetical protein
VACKSIIPFFAFLLLTISLCACSRGTRPSLGLVHGKVSLGGRPLAGAVVAFMPEGSGRESSALTNENGDYTLSYIRDIQGAAVGWHSVRITTESAYSGKPELVPERYNVKTELRKNVVAGDNEINFNLSSK